MSTIARPNYQPAPMANGSRMALTAITGGRLQRPMRVLLYGTEGVGKSSFAAAAPAPVFIGTEDGTAHLDVERFPEPHNWNDILDAIQTLTVNDHPYKTVVVDTVDWAEPLCWAHVSAEAKKDTIEDFGYGKGYVVALTEWRKLLSRLDKLRDLRSMHVILLAHSWIKPFKNPEGDDFDRYELKLHQKASGLLKEWADAVLFANYETFAVEKSGRIKGVSSGSRVVHTERRAAWDAKNRYGLPETIPLSWDEFTAAVKAGTPADSATLRGLLDALIPDLGTHEPKAREALERAGNNSTKLAQLLDWARGKKALEMSKEETSS